MCHYLQGLLGLRLICGGAIEWWEVAKEWTRPFCIRYSKCRARKREAEVRKLQRRLEWEQALANSGGDPDVETCENSGN